VWSFTQWTLLERLARLVLLLRRVVACSIPWVRDKLGQKLMTRMLARGDSIGRDIIAAVSDSVFEKVFAAPGSAAVQSGMQLYEMNNTKATLNPHNENAFLERCKVSDRAPHRADAHSWFCSGLLYP
jgi:hypothetical protein